MERKKTKIKQPTSDRVFDVVNWIILTFAMLMVLYPLVYILSCSFSAPRAVTAGKVWLYPVEFSTYGYETVLGFSNIWRGYGNSLLYMVVGTAIGVVTTVAAAYPLSRKELRGRKAFNVIFFFTMLFNGGIVPTYLLIQNLNIYDTMWAIVLPGSVSAWNIIVMRTFFEGNIPVDLYEAAELDGCGDFGILFRIVLPLSGAILAVISLFFAVWLWNSYYSALMYLASDDKYPLQIILRQILIMNDTSNKMFSDIDALVRKQGVKDVLKFGLIVVSSLPLLVAYPFVQKYFVKGIMVGSVKG